MAAHYKHIWSSGGKTARTGHLYFSKNFKIILISIWILKGWKFLEMRIPDHLTCLLRNLYAGQETTIRTGHGTMDWLQIGNGVCQGCILSPWLFNLYAAHHEKWWAGWNTSWNQDCQEKFRYADDTMLMVESKELKSLLMKVKEESEKVQVRCMIQDTRG